MHKKWLIKTVIAIIATSQAFASPTVIPILKEDAPNIVWSHEREVIQHIFMHCRKISYLEQENNDCLAKLMAFHGASKQSIAFAKAFGGWVSTIQSIDKFIIAHANVIRAPNHTMMVIITPQGECIDTDDSSIVDAKLLAANSQYKPFLTQYPQSMLGMNKRNIAEHTTKEDKTHIFSIVYPLVNGCLSCKHIGDVTLNFLFDAKGYYLGVAVKNIKRRQTVDEHSSKIQPTSDLDNPLDEPQPYGITPAPGDTRPHAPA